MQPSAEEVIAVARSFRNVVLEGPPGTGKTRLIGEVARTWTDVTGRPLGGDGRGAWAITLHPNTSYEDFIGGIRVDGHGRFDYVAGFLQQKVAHAILHPEQDHLVLLDEINRANVPRVLGEALLSIEASKRLQFDQQAQVWGGGLTVTLQMGISVLQEHGVEGFGVPDNLFLMATMNTTDRSVAGLDSALRRRFAFIRLPPLAARDVSDAVADQYGAAVAEVVAPSAAVVEELNENMLRPVLGADHVLGHSYFFDMAEATSSGPRDSAVRSLADEIHSWTTKEGEPIEDAFWVEVSEGTGEKRNQIDLSKGGRVDRDVGSAHFFLGGQLPEGAATRAVGIEYRGVQYTGSELKYYGGANPNGTWRLNLKGTAGTLHLGDFGHSDFRRHVLVFLRTGDDQYAMRSLSLTAVPQLVSWGTSDTNPGSSRRFGRLERQQSSLAAPLAVRHSWQYALLPQLFDVVSSYGAEALLLTDSRAAFLDGRAELHANERSRAADAGSRLDQHLAAMGLRVDGAGTGLSRTLVAELVLENRRIDAGPVPGGMADDVAAGGASA